ncbi:MAG: hypothetical protein ABJL99_19540 [Aliishimia sp.]
MHDDNRTSAPDFTNACIVMFGVNIAWVFMVIWAIWGLIFVMMLGAVINHMMTRISEWSLARAAQQRANPKARARW